MKKYVLLCGLLLSIWSLQAQEKIYEDVNQVIRKHGLEESQVMDIASWLCDIYGPRLTGSPMLDKATKWSEETLKEWGLSNVHLEEWGPFGRGWEMSHFEMHAVSPNYFPIIAYPKAWSPSTNGPVEGEVVYFDASEEADFEKYRGKLKGKFVMVDTVRVLKEWFDTDGTAERFDSEKLLEMANASMPTPRRFRNWRGSGYEFVRKMRSFLLEQKPLALIDRSYKGDLGTVFVSGARTSKGRARDQGAEVIPQVTMSVEHYNRIFRMLHKGLNVKLSMELKAQYTNKDGMEHNIIAEIPGTDLKDEIVMFGAHFDSWHSGTGATDNGAGSAVMMEAARILMETIKETGIQPRRTLRLALWTGEEQGLLGSRAYIREHCAVLDTFGNFVSAKPMQEKISAYYNLDNGTGKIRGVYLQGNPEVGPIFRTWLDEFKDLEASTLTLSNTGGTDHRSFDAVGIPGFQFIQDPISYWSRTHHSNMDNWDHLVPEDLQQAATIIASFVFHTAQRAEKLPRKKQSLAK
ncbi:MAG: M20/M25/M40 family metallo-hydrolase [Bacteroidota bacterium]